MIALYDRCRPERAEIWDVVCPFTDQLFRVQFWDCHDQDRFGKRRMAIAVWANSPAFPTCFNLVGRSRHYTPGMFVSCDGAEAALHAVGLLLATTTAGEAYQDVFLDDPESPPTVTDAYDQEGTWIRRSA